MAIDIEWKSILFILKFYNSQWIAWLVIEYNVSSQKEYNVESNTKTIITTKKASWYILHMERKLIFIGTKI